VDFIRPVVSLVMLVGWQVRLRYSIDLTQGVHIRTNAKVFHEDSTIYTYFIASAKKVSEKGRVASHECYDWSQRRVCQLNLLSTPLSLKLFTVAVHREADGEEICVFVCSNKALGPLPMAHAIQWPPTSQPHSPFSYPYYLGVFSDSFYSSVLSGLAVLRAVGHLTQNRTFSF
jgi:hypothetical protein